MKSLSTVVVLLLASTTGAFVPTANDAVNAKRTRIADTTRLFAASIDQVKPNPAIKLMAQGMGLLKPVFGAEAQIQAAVLGKIGNVDEEKVMKDIQATISKDKVVIYTYSLSPFSTEAVRILKESGYEFEQVELGAEWFLLGGRESVTRVALSKMVDSGATSLPKIFIGGNCIGGCSELAALVESGEVDVLMKQQKVSKVGQAPKKVFGRF
jgi:glutaredoxin-related protein